MSILLRNNKLLIVGFFISIFFLTINIITLDWYPLPWVDEVGTADTPINVALYGKWFTTAWNYSYNLLHALLLIPWIHFFGVSHVAVTSLNVTIAFFLSLLLLRYLINSKIINSIWHLIIFISIFWGAGILSWNFRCGRIDVLVMFFTFLVVSEILKFKTFQIKNCIRLFILSFLLFLSGVPSIPFVFFILFIFFIFQSHYNKIIYKQTLIFMSACLVGFFFVSIFYWFQGYLIHYWGSFISFNENITGKKNILDRILDSYSLNQDALILSSLNILLITHLLYKRIISLNSFDVIFSFSCLFVPLIMTLSGRYEVYYSWLFFLPSLIISISLLSKFSTFIKIFISLIMAFIFITGFPNSLLKGDKNTISRINKFIKNQPITSKDLVVSDYLPYYALKNTTKRCYFPAANSSILVDKSDSIMKPSLNRWKSHFLFKLLQKQLHFEKKYYTLDRIDFVVKSPESYGTDFLNSFIKKQRSLGKTVTVIDSMSNPTIVIYQVK